MKNIYQCLRTDTEVSFIIKTVIMIKLYLTACTFAFLFISGEIDWKNVKDLPSWIRENPAFRNSTEKDSIKTGNGSISSKEIGNQSWLIYLNEKAGHGIEVELQKLSLNPNLNDFLMVCPWPLTADFKQIKLFTGKFDKPLRKLRIPNTAAFYVLYSTSPYTKSPEMALTYGRYGRSLERKPPPTDNPPKKKDTVFEIQLKGKSVQEYSNAEFSEKLKEALRASARRYCTINKIPFNDSIATREMVLMHKISFCPFEWPERHICASVEHSIFVSGIRNPGEEFILDYQLTVDNLKAMWNQKDFQELQELGITVFELPPTYSTILYWGLIIGLIIISSFIGIVIFWKTNEDNEISSRPSSATLKEVKKGKKPKMKLAKHQRIPSFMYTDGKNNQTENYEGPVRRSTNEEISFKEKFEDVLKPGDSSGLPIRNYLGSILFSNNKAFEDDEGSPVELRPKLT